MTTFLTDGSGRFLLDETGAFLTTEFPVAPYADYDWSNASKVIDAETLRPMLDPTVDTVGYSRYYNHGSHIIGHWDRAINGVRVLNYVPHVPGEVRNTGNDGFDVPAGTLPTAVDVLLAVSFDEIPPLHAAVLTVTPAVADGWDFVTNGDPSHDTTVATWDDSGTRRWCVVWHDLSDTPPADEAILVFRTAEPVATGPQVLGLRLDSRDNFGLRVNGNPIDFVDCHARIPSDRWAGWRQEVSVFTGTDETLSVEDGLALLPARTNELGLYGFGSGTITDTAYLYGLPELAGVTQYVAPDDGPTVGYTGWEYRILAFPTLSDVEYGATVAKLRAPVTPVVTDVPA